MEACRAKLRDLWTVQELYKSARETSRGNDSSVEWISVCKGLRREPKVNEGGSHEHIWRSRSKEKQSLIK